MRIVFIIELFAYKGLNLYRKNSMLKYIEINNITLYNENCLDVFNLIEQNSVDLLVTDPPYKIVSGGNTTKRMVGGIFHHTVYNNNGDLVQQLSFDKWIPKIRTILKNNSDLYIMINSNNMQELLTILYKEDIKLHNILIWDKGNVTPNRWYMKANEFTIYSYIGKARPINDMGTSTIARISNPRNKTHPTEKPVELMEIYIKNSSQENDTIIDPFMGSGATAIACMNTNRKFIGIELDTNYFNIAVKRCMERLYL